MSDAGPGIGELITAARSDRDALGTLLERYRPFLLLMAQQRIGFKLRVRCDPEDAVQETVAEALRDFDKFTGSSEPEFSAWIKRAHRRNLDDIVRKHCLAQNRRLDRERSLFDADGSASFYWREPAAEQTSPSQRLIKGEKAIRLAALLQSLSPMQREAVRLQILEGWSLKAIAQELDRSETAVAGLLRRGLKALKDKMAVESWF